MSEKEQIKNLPELLGVTSKRISELKENTKDLVIFDEKSFAATKQARTEIVTLRTSVEKRRKEVIEPYRGYIANVNETAKNITSELIAIESPLQENVKNWERKKQEEKLLKEKIEKERISNIRSVIHGITATPMGCIRMCSAEISRVYYELKSEVIKEDEYSEFFQEAKEAQKKALEQLEIMQAEKAGIEEEEKIQAEERKKQEEERRLLEEERRKLAEEIEKNRRELEFQENARSTIAMLENFSSLFVDKNSDQLRQLKIRLERMKPEQAILNGYYKEAFSAYQQVGRDLDDQIEQAASQEREELERREYERFASTVIKEAVELIEDNSFCPEKDNLDQFDSMVDAMKQSVEHINWLKMGSMADKAKEELNSCISRLEKKSTELHIKYAVVPPVVEAEEFPTDHDILVVAEKKSMTVYYTDQVVCQSTCDSDLPAEWAREMERIIRDAYDFGVSIGKKFG